MKKVGYVEKVTHELSPDIWNKLIDEVPELERHNGEEGFDDPLHAYVVYAKNRVGEFEWSEDNQELIVRGESEVVRMLSERIAVRLGGRYMPVL